MIIYGAIQVSYCLSLLPNANVSLRLTLGMAGGFRLLYIVGFLLHGGTMNAITDI